MLLSEWELAMQVQMVFEIIGGRLSNTSVTYPIVRDNFGKLKVIPDIR